MRTSNQLRLAAVVGVTLLVATATGAAAAGPPPTYLCSELRAQQPDERWVHGRHLDGNLLVDIPRCVVVSSTVTGDVTVGEGAYLALAYVTVTGDIRREPGAQASWTEVGASTVHGAVDAHALSVIDSTVHGDIAADATTTPPDLERGWPYRDPLLVVHASRLGGDVRLAGDVLDVSASSVVGTVDATGGEFARFRVLSVGGGVTVRGDARLVMHGAHVQGALHADGVRDVLVCRTGIRGDLVLEATRMWTRVGEEGQEQCRTTVGGSVRVVDNPSSVILGDLAVGGDLVCANNTGSQGVVRRPGLTVAGAVSPGCAPVAPPAPPADPPAVQLCSELPLGWGGQRDLDVLDGDLLADGDCEIWHALVHGDVVVPAGGTFHALDLDVRGRLRVGGSALLDTTRVLDGMVLDSATEVRLEGSTIGAGVTGSAGELTLSASGALGDVVVTTTTATRLTRSVVGGSVDARGGRLIVHGTGVRGALTSTGATDALVCRASVRGDLTVTDVQGWSRIGQERQELCRTTVGGSVHVVDNPHSVVLDDLVVAGDLLCTGNTGPQTVVRTDRLTVAGNRTGQCA